MQGSRHERAALVGVAYFIGALTAFIWFSETKVNPNNLVTNNPQVASVVEALPSENDATVEVVSQEPKSAVSYSNGMLEVEALGGVRVLSFDPSLSGIESNADFEAQGTHTGTLNYSASPSEEYVFFCEQKTVSSETCRPFVYDVLADTIYPLRKDGDRVDLLISASADVSWQENALMIGNEVSKDQRKPWLLGF